VALAGEKLLVRRKANSWLSVASYTDRLHRAACL